MRLSYYNMYSMKELGVAGGCFFLQHSALSGGIHIASFGYDAWRETMFRLPVGKRLSERLALGVSVQYAVLQTELYEEQPARLTVDAGMVWEAVDRLTLGLLLMNYPSVIISADDSMRQAGFMPPRIQAGAQWQAGSDVVLAATIDWAEFRKVGLHAGIAYKAFERFEFRSGIKLPSLLPSFGVGYEWRPLVVDIAAAYHPVLGFGRGIGISYMF